MTDASYNYYHVEPIPHIMGIDVGNTGAIAIYYPQNDDWVIIDMPVIITKSGNKEKKQYDGFTLAEIMRANKAECMHLGIERQQVMPKQGAVSGGNLMRGYGMIEGIALALRMPYTLVDPKIWKKEMMAGMPKEKEASVLRASQLFPNIAEQFYGPKGGKLHGRADAVLITEYVRKNLV